MTCYSFDWRGLWLIFGQFLCFAFATRPATKSYQKKINEWPKIQPNNGATLREYSDFLLHCQTAAKEIHYLKILNDQDKNKNMAKKLLWHLIDWWSREVDRWLNKEQNRGDDSSPRHSSAAMYPFISAFCKFVNQKSHAILLSPAKHWEKKRTRKQTQKGH